MIFDSAENGMSGGREESRGRGKKQGSELILGEETDQVLTG
jgi:hypothetical protein